MASTRGIRPQLLLRRVPTTLTRTRPIEPLTPAPQGHPWNGTIILSHYISEYHIDYTTGVHAHTGRLESWSLEYCRKIAREVGVCI